MSEITVRDIGEFGLIEALRGALPPATIAGPLLRLGIGDDAAVWTPEPGESVVITTDSLVEGIHFRLDWTDWRSLGHKVLAVNLSDLAAMGSAPKLAVLTLGLRGTEPVSGLHEMYGGIGEIAARFGVLIAGGDIVRSPHATTIDVTAFGVTRGGRYLMRSGARIGDVIAVSGTIGASAAGYHLLRDGGPARSAVTADLLIGSHLRPQPRIELGALLLELGATAAMDLSDGLFGDLPKILSASGVSAVIEEVKIPVAAAVRALFADTWLDLATRGGEDYELLFTASPEVFEEIRARAAAIGSTVTAIGEITEREVRPTISVRDSSGSIREVQSGAFDHFR